MARDKVSAEQIEHIQSAFNNYINTPSRDTQQVLLDAMKPAPILRDALIPLLSRESSMYGKEFHNPYGAGRSSVLVHPYAKQGTGVSVTFQYTDKATGEIFSLLPKKLVKRRTADQARDPIPKNGAQLIWDQLGGYIHGAPLEGGKMQALSHAEGEAKDKAEEENLLQQKVVLTDNTSSASGEERITPKYLDEMGKVIIEYYRDTIRSKPDYTTIGIDPEKMKEHLRSKGFQYDADYNSTDAALREAREETSYNGVLTAAMVQDSFPEDNYGINNVARLHTANVNKVIDLGILEQAPKIHAITDIEREPNSFRADGTEIAELAWAGSHSIKRAKGYDPAGEMLMQDQRATFEGYFIRPDYIVTLEKNIQLTRKKQVQEASEGSYESAASVRKRVGRVLKSICSDPEETLVNLLGTAPISQLGEEATHYHRRIVETARYLNALDDTGRKFEIESLKARFEEQGILAPAAKQPSVYSGYKQFGKEQVLEFQDKFRASKGYADAVEKGRIMRDQRSDSQRGV